MAEVSESQSLQVVKVDALQGEIEKLEGQVRKFGELSQALAAKIEENKKEEQAIYSKWANTITKTYGETFSKKESPKTIKDMEGLISGLKKDIKV